MNMEIVLGFLIILMFILIERAVLKCCEINFCSQKGIKETHKVQNCKNFQSEETLQGFEMENVLEASQLSCQESER